MHQQKLNYQCLRRQGEAVGVCSVVHPFLRLWEATKGRFLRDAVSMVRHGIAVPHVEDLLEDFGFGPGTYSLEEWFQHYRPQPLRLTWDAASLGKLADVAEDLTRDNGLWKENASDLDSAEQDAIGELERRLEQVCQEVAVRFGPGAVSKVLAIARQNFVEETRTWARPRPWSSRLTEELQQIVHTVRTYARPRSVSKKLLLRIRPGLAASWWLSDSQRRNLERKLYPQILKAHQLRFDQERDRRKRRIAESLLGRSNTTGLLDQALAKSLTQEGYFDKLASAVVAPQTEMALDAHALITADNLDVVLDSARNRTLGDLYQDAISRTGCSAADFAAQLNHDGLPMHGRTYKPVEWVHVRLFSVLEALQRAADLYLGSHDLNAPLRIENPKSAFESAAAITLTHPELQPLVTNLLPTLVQRSRPYAEIRHVVGGEPTIYSLLYCYPADRRHFERRLQTRVTLSNALSADGDNIAYQVKHPYALTLIQFAVAAPFGSLKSLGSWVRQSNLLRKNGTSPLFDFTGAPEIRRLSERPSEYDDCRQLFAAACAFRLFSPLGSGTPTRYALASVDPRLEILFAPAIFVPEWKTDEFFHQALQKPEFIRSLEIAFPAVANLGPTAGKLAREIDAHKVATALEQLGVLEAATTGRHFRIRWKGAPRGLPKALFRRRKGSMIGLSAEKCIAELHRNDDLYNTVFWGVCDALDFGQLSPNDVPPFLLNFAKSL